MHQQRLILLSLAIPAISGGGLVGVCAYWLLGPAAAALVLCGSLITVAGVCDAIARQARTAQTQLQHPDFRSSVLHDAGIFQTVLQAVFPRLEKLEGEVERATRAQMESQAIQHVRQKQARRLEATFQGLIEPVLVTDAGSEPVFWNAAALRVLQVLAKGSGSASSLTGKPQLDAVPAVRDLIKETCARGAAAGSRAIEIEGKYAGDKLEPSFQAVAGNILDDDQSSIGVVVLFHDLTSQKAEKSRHAEFVSSVCHELKTPLSSMKAFIEMLADGDVTEFEQQLELYGFIDVQIDRLTRLINNMLNLARIESGVIKIQREDCGLNEVLEKALEVVAPMAHEKRIQLIPELSELYLPVNVDRDLFGQGVINLLSNAIKYTPEGGEVHLQSRMGEAEAVIEVRDNGMGIPEDSLPRLFQRFYRVPENNKAAAGTGLGLALVQYIVADVHNGRVSVSSKVNAGSCFTVQIPLGHRKSSKRKTEPAACPA